MEYGKIVAVSGLPGLYELLSSKGDGAIVRSLDDKTTRFVSSRVHNFSHLESIEVFTVRDNVNLIEVFHAIEKSDQKLPDEKDNTGLKKYFEEVYPDIDFTRVYTSDLKKMVKWYDILAANNIEIKLTEQPPEDEQATEESTEAVDEEKIEKKGKGKKEPVAKEEKKESKKTTPKEEVKEKKATKSSTKKSDEKKAPAKKSSKKASK